MGALEVFPNRPDPSYVWEMLQADTGELFMHFDVSVEPPDGDVVY